MVASVGTAKNALKLADVGVPVLTLDKTIDNDVAGTDITFGFDTAMSIPPRRSTGSTRRPTRTPTPADRPLATRLGTAYADFIADGVHGVLVAARGEITEAVPLKQVATKTKTVPLDHPWIGAARHLGVALGD